MKKVIFKSLLISVLFLVSFTGKGAETSSDAEFGVDSQATEAGYSFDEQATAIPEGLLASNDTQNDTQQWLEAQRQALEQQRIEEEVRQGKIGDMKYIGLKGADTVYPLEMIFSWTPSHIPDQWQLWDSLQTEENDGMVDSILPGLGDLATTEGCYLNGEKVMELHFYAGKLNEIWICSSKIILVSDRTYIWLPFTAEEIQSFTGYNETYNIRLGQNRIYITQRK